MRRKLKVHQQDTIEVEEVKGLKKDAYTPFREEDEEIKEVAKRFKTGQKYNESGDSGSNGHGRPTQTKGLGFKKAWVAQSKKMQQREDHLGGGGGGGAEKRVKLRDKMAKHL